MASARYEKIRTKELAAHRAFEAYMGTMRSQFGNRSINELPPKQRAKARKLEKAKDNLMAQRIKIAQQEGMRE